MMEPTDVGWSAIGITAAAFMAMHIFAVHKDFRGAQNWLRRAFPGLTPGWIHRLDCLLVVLLGTMIALFAFEPRTPMQAVAAGMGWVGILNTLGHQPNPVLVSESSA
jgi:hypothetical protein